MRYLIKFLILPVVMILSLMKLILDGATRIYCLVAGIAINMIVICAVLAVVTRQWMALGIFAVIFVGVIAILFFAGTIMVALDGIKERLKAV